MRFCIECTLTLHRDGTLSVELPVFKRVRLGAGYMSWYKGRERHEGNEQCRDELIAHIKEIVRANVFTGRRKVKVGIEGNVECEATGFVLHRPRICFK